MSQTFPGKGKVAALKSEPGSVLTDIGELMHRAGHQEALAPNLATVLKTALVGRTWYPGRSSTPWQIEGVIRQLRGDGYARLIAVQNDVQGSNAYAAERNQKQKYVIDKYGVENVHLSEPHIEWVVYEPKTEMLVLHDVFPEGIRIPRMFIGKNIVHLPTMRSSTWSRLHGAMQNALSGLLKRQPAWSQTGMHKAVVDVLAIQQEIHPGVFAVMDGTLIAGESQPPCALNTLLASADSVAIDAIGAVLLGVNPMEIESIRLAHENGLGIGNPKDIEILGHGISLEEAASTLQDCSANGPGHRSVKEMSPDDSSAPLQHKPLSMISETVGDLYQKTWWLPFVGRQHVSRVLTTSWGRMFKTYDDGKVVLPTPEPKSTAMVVAIAFLALFAFLRVFRR